MEEKSLKGKEKTDMLRSISIGVRLSVRLSVPSIDSQYAAAGLLQTGRRLPAAHVDQYLPPAPERRNERAASYALIRGTGINTYLFIGVCLN